MQGVQAEAAGTRVICFWLRGRHFGVDLAHVQETIVLRPVTRVFLTPPWITGIINLRGDVVALIDLAAFLGLGRTEPTPDSRILVARPEGRRMGIVCDRLGSVRLVETASMGAAPSTLGDEAAALTAGVVTADGEPLVILDFVKLAGSERLAQFRRKASS
jgi:purine-binding chemotaxis protein CheW